MERPLFASWQGLPAPLVTDGGEVGAGGDHCRASLLRAVALGASGAALSVRLTGDGVPVLFRLPRTGSASRENLVVAATAAGALRRLRLKGGEEPLFLDEALSLLPARLPLLVILLAPGAAAAVAPLLATAEGRGETAILSPLREELLVAGALLPRLPRALLGVRPSLSDGAFCARHGLWIAPKGSSLTAIRCARLVKDGVSFLANGVETPSVRDHALSLGASALLTRHLARLLPGGISP